MRIHFALLWGILIPTALVGSGLFMGRALAIEGDKQSAVADFKQKKPFDLKLHKPFIDHDLSRPKPSSSLQDMGLPARDVAGTLTDHAGNPIQDALVAIVEPIGYSRHCYFDNFDMTDSEGRFRVRGGTQKTRLIFRVASGKLWVHHVGESTPPSPIDVTWPESGGVLIQVPASLAKPSSDVVVRSKAYWSGMSVMSQSAKLNESGIARVDELMPADYVVTVSQEVVIGGKTEQRQVDIGHFRLKAGEIKQVKCVPGKTTLTGRLSSGGVIQPSYVVIERIQESYVDQPVAADYVSLSKEGSFRSRPLPAGTYSVRAMMANVGQPGRFGFGGATVAVQQWLVTIDESQDLVDLDELPARSDVFSIVDQEIDRALRGTGRRSSSSSAGRLVKHEKRAEIELELLRLMTDAGYPYNKRRQIPTILGGMLDSPAVVMGLLGAIEHPLNVRERREYLRAVGQSTVHVDAIVDQLESLIEDSDHIARGIVVRGLGTLAVRNPEHRPRIEKLLVRCLDDGIATTRSTAIDFLGQINAADSVPALMAAAEDEYRPAAVTAGYAIWKITGDADATYGVMTRVLGSEGLSGMWEAAYFMQQVAEKHPVPDDTRRVLRRVSKMAGKPPFRNSFEYEQSRAAKAAQKVLDLVAER